MQGAKFGAFALELGGKRVFFLTPQTPFAQSEFAAMSAALKAKGGESDILIYDDKKPSYRSEVEAALRFKPDTLVLGGYTPDTSVLLKDLFRAGFKGHMLAFGYAVNQKLLDGVPAEISEGIYTLSPSPAEGSGGYNSLVKLIGVASPDPYTTQIYDHINLILMSIALAGQSSGTAIKDSIRKLGEPGGVVVNNALDGLAAIAAGKKVTYDGASGPCQFCSKRC